MEQCLIELLASYGVTAAAKPDAPGVYVDGAKSLLWVCGFATGCSFHGLALNVDMNLEPPFRRINPCGYAGLAMTQLSDHAGSIEFAEVSARLRARLVKHLDYAEQATLTAESTDMTTDAVQTLDPDARRDRAPGPTSQG